MPHYPCHWRQNKPRTPMPPSPPAGVQFPTTNMGQRWTVAGVRSSLTSASAGRSQSHIKLSEGPKVPIRSVNSSIVLPPPWLKGPSVTRHLLQWSGPPPHWAHRYSNSPQLIHGLFDCWFLFPCQVELQRLQRRAPVCVFLEGRR